MTYPVICVTGPRVIFSYLFLAPIEVYRRHDLWKLQLSLRKPGTYAPRKHRQSDEWMAELSNVVQPNTSSGGASVGLVNLAIFVVLLVAQFLKIF